MTRRLLLIGTGLLAAGVAAVYLLRPDVAPAVDFVDNLTGPTSAQFDIPFDTFTLSPEGLLRAHSDSGRENGTDRPVVRTRSDRYLSRDFVFEVDLSIPPDVQDIVFVGVGAARSTAPFNEPGAGFGFRVHHLPDNREVRLAAVTLPQPGAGITYPFQETLGSMPADGTITLRLERNGDQIIGSLPGQPDSERRIRISAYPSILSSGQGFLYLSNTAEGTVFSNVRVRPRT